MAQHKTHGRFDEDAASKSSLSGPIDGLAADFLDLPSRTRSPRESGLTLAIDGGLPTALFRDSVESHAGIIDIVKFGWGTALATQDIQRKLDILRFHGIDYFFGGTLFEKALQQDRVERYFDFCAEAGCSWLEISNGTLEIAAEDKARHIAAAARRFRVMSEVGYKDSERSERLSAQDWIAEIRSDFTAGAEMVVTEARESGTSGICGPDGRLRDGLIESILGAGIPPDALIFEAPNKVLQTYFIGLVGCNVNLGNIAFADLVGLETLRLGLRSDTLLFAKSGART